MHRVSQSVIIVTFSKINVLRFRSEMNVDLDKTTARHIDITKIGFDNHYYSTTESFDCNNLL